jgi:hypothetical protein
MSQQDMDTTPAQPTPVAATPVAHPGMQEVNILPTATPQDIERKIKAFELACTDATKKMEDCVKVSDYINAREWQVVAESSRRP